MANRKRSSTTARTSARTQTKRRAATDHSHEGIAAWLSELFGGEDHEVYRATPARARTTVSTRSVARAGAKRATAATTRSGRSLSARSTTVSPRRRAAGTMSRSEAGRAGGLAPHRCRGRECSTMKTASRSRSGSSRSSY